jgi:hypothetical protein
MNWYNGSEHSGHASAIYLYLGVHYSMVYVYLKGCSTNIVKPVMNITSIK